MLPISQRVPEQHHQRLGARIDPQMLLVETEWIGAKPAVTWAPVQRSIGSARLSTRLVSPPATG